MKSAVFYGRHDLRVQESAVPEPGPEEVLIQVKACGVCGTDVHIYEGDKGAAEVNPPAILGHEFSGVIAAVGSEVRRFHVGDRVCIDPNRYCGACDYCRGGEVHFCEHMIGYGTTQNGGFAEYCAVNESQVYLLGEHTTFEQGAMAEPAACCLHGIDLCEIRPGSQVVIIGGGMIGLLMLQLAKLAGASKAALLEPVEKKREIGAKLGADICIDPLTEDTGARLAEAGFTWIRTVIECAGLPSTMEQAIALAGKKGTVMLFGLTKPDAQIAVMPFEIFRKELTIKASYINPCTQQRALQLIDSGRLDVQSMVCGTIGLEQLEEVLQNPSVRAAGKYIVIPEK
ncbi:MAG: zinc-dependent alcohol dehydrogenase family protein [Lachnospiraceae bacterium]|nr:zinc-dependent alcohol dehydrogenase family protein [Lachnospiraceae bacterium]